MESGKMRMVDKVVAKMLLPMLVLMRREEEEAEKRFKLMGVPAGISPTSTLLKRRRRGEGGRAGNSRESMPPVATARRNLKANKVKARVEPGPGQKG